MREGWVAYLDPLTIAGDFDRSGELNVADIDLLTEKVAAGTHPSVFDLTGDSLVNQEDRRFWVEEFANTYFGDANLDGEFGTSDLVAVFIPGEYEDAIDGNSTWATGDWNGDGDFESADLVLAFQGGGYEQGPRMAANAVPELTAGWLLAIGLLGIVATFRRATTGQRVCQSPIMPRGALATAVSRYCFVFALPIIASLQPISTACASRVVSGSNYQLHLQELPVTADATLTFDGQEELIADGQVVVNERVVREGPSWEWLEWTFDTSDGSPLIGDVSSTLFNIRDLRFSETVVYTPRPDNHYLLFASNGVPIAAESETDFYLVDAHPFDETVPNVLRIKSTVGGTQSDSHDFFLSSRVFKNLADTGIEPGSITGGALGIRLDALTIRGDFNNDGVLDAADIDLLRGNDPSFDLTGDGLVNRDDREYWVHELADTYSGDANLDGEFNSSDLVDVFEAGKYEQDVAANWSEGDWDGDGYFGTGDLVAAFEEGGYEQGPRAAVNAVPEPASIVLLMIGLIGVTFCHRRNG